MSWPWYQLTRAVADSSLSCVSDGIHCVIIRSWLPPMFAYHNECHIENATTQPWIWKVVWICQSIFLLTWPAMQVPSKTTESFCLAAECINFVLSRALHILITEKIISTCVWKLCKYLYIAVEAFICVIAIPLTVTKLKLLLICFCNCSSCYKSSLALWCQAFSLELVIIVACKHFWQSSDPSKYCITTTYG